MPEKHTSPGGARPIAKDLTHQQDALHLVTSVTGRPLVTALCFELRLYENDRTQRNSASR